jgi:hypothetical protein
MKQRLFLISTVVMALALNAIHDMIARAQEPANARIWIGREAEIEQFIKTAKVVKLEELKIGVTRPRRATLAPGGPVEAFAWKPIRPGRYSGYWESYRSEIAAYELDKFLALGMIPPTVERQVEGQTGAAVMWAAPVKSFKDMGGVPGSKGVEMPPPARMGVWNQQLTRAKMLDNLIGNIDPNLGNWLVDPAWNLILIDHTRSFTSTNKLYHQMSSVDMALWEKMKALDEATLEKVIGQWLERGMIKGILDRRDKMQEVIDKLKTR